MTTQIRILLGSILLLTAAMASAQNQRVSVKVPFSFVVGGQSLPAGDYTIELNRERNIVVLRSEDRFGQARATMARAMMTETSNKLTAAPDKSYAIFQRYGGHYFLAEIWRQGAGQVLTPGKLEQELARKSSTEQKVTLAAQLSPQ
jgi:hypothetical protein